MAVAIISYIPFLLASPTSVLTKDIRHCSSKKYTRVVVDLDGPFSYQYGRLKSPDRLYFDIQDATIGDNLVKKSISIGDGLLRGIRVSQFSPEVVRVVLDLDSIESYKVFTMENPDRLVIDIFALQSLPKIQEETPTYEIKKIVIDPGHGGHDPGAIGRGGLKEKDVVLDIAKRLAKMIKKDLKIDTILTRQRDIFIPLDERTAIANMSEADLFISIHANASRNRHAKGIETYILNYTNDEEANRVAARENAISLKSQKEMQRRFMDDLEKTLGDLERDWKRDESLRLAHLVQKAKIEHLMPTYSVLDRGVKQALFYVLIGAKMPGILAEVSFISNPEEGKRLADRDHRQKIAKGLLAGIKNYISTNQRPLRSDKGG